VREAVAALPWLVPPRRGQLLGGLLHRLDDVVVARAAADVALEAVADLLLGGLRVLVEQRAGGDDHPRRAEAALQAVLVPESLLDGMELAGLGDALDGGDLPALELHGEERAALDGLAVDEHRARSALARVAADVRARQTQHIAQEMHEEEPWLDLASEVGPVDVDADGAHGASSRTGVPENARRQRCSDQGSLANGG